jgi:hypothetical protein
MLLPIHIYFYPYLVSIKSEYVTIVDRGIGDGPVNACIVKESYIFVPIIV